MVNVNKAVAIVCSKYPLQKVIACKELPDRWVFAMKNINSDVNPEHIGTHFPSVIKSSGKFEFYNITSNPQAFLNGKNISVENVYDKPIGGDPNERLA